MTDQEIEERLRVHVLNLCLATACKREGDISVCKKMLVAEVAAMLRESSQQFKKKEKTT